MVLQAIQIKYLPHTNTKPARLKVFATAGFIIESVSTNLDLEHQKKLLVERFMIEKTWNGNCVISGQGVLPNGNDVFTLGKLT